MKKEVLLISIAYQPNIGGVETHLSDLVKELIDDHWFVNILTYQPLETDVAGVWIEKKKNLFLLRLPVIKKLFYKLVKIPILEFIFLEPLLFISTPVILILKPSIKTISAQGLVAGMTGVFWGKIFRKKITVSFHSIYRFPKKGLYVSFVRWMLASCDKILTLSEQSKKEIELLGIPSQKIYVFTYWIDQTIFAPVDKKNAKNTLKLNDIFTVLFVGRLIKEKGITELLESFKKWDKNIQLVIAGTGPFEKLITQLQKIYSNLIFAGAVSQNFLPLYYNAADVIIVPSIHEEGFGRVILESLSCGTPVIAANRGGIKEALTGNAGYLIKINPETIKKTVEYVYHNKKELEEKSKYAVKFAKQNYSAKNAHDIIKNYE